MNPYPNQNDPNQANQYPPNQGQAGGGYQTPPTVPSGYGEQPPYQQQAFQQPPYQAPYQQSPYQQSPYPQNTLALDWRYLTAGIGALVSLIAFFLPYEAINYGLGPYGGTVTVSGFQEGHQILLDLILALVAIALVLLLQFGNQVFKAPSSPTIQKLMNSLNTQQRTWGLALLVVGAFGIFFRFILDLGSLGLWGIGSWLYLVGMIAVAVGGFFIWRPLNSSPAQVPPVR